MPDPTDVVVFAQGASLPVEVDFGIDPLGVVGPNGDIEIAATASVPEPASFTLLLVGAAGMGLLLRRNLFGVRTSLL
jgi:PEP-CTERM motif